MKLQNPIFTEFASETAKMRPELVFYEDDEMMIFPNNKEHTRKKQVRKDRGSTQGESAAMSYVHMLAIPKRRIYNAVSLTRDDAPLLRRMMEKAKEALMKPEAQNYYLEHKDFDLSADVLDAEQMGFFVHCHPSHSVGHLHVHCCLRNLWTKNGALLATKNLLLRHVIAELDHESTTASPMTERAIFKMKEAHTLSVSLTQAAGRRSVVLQNMRAAKNAAALGVPQQSTHGSSKVEV